MPEPVLRGKVALYAHGVFRVFGKNVRNEQIVVYHFHFSVQPGKVEVGVMKPRCGLCVFPESRKRIEKRADGRQFFIAGILRYHQLPDEQGGSEQREKKSEYAHGKQGGLRA